MPGGLVNEQVHPCPYKLSKKEPSKLHAKLLSVKRDVVRRLKALTVRLFVQIQAQSNYQCWAFKQDP